ncbi:DUF1553 domain-containing protein [Gimesia panareensis]|uniref:DUF1553 domain-containing protein n=1 Tax=Gimesia panareensis TaxID=2527978 RepID=UPI00118CDEBB|nr:DUF1553 domain-containing protein [Gimesia panareensis]QDU48205.1 Planctomycete cytochrome C [Gimesia panareensis]
MHAGEKVWVALVLFLALAMPGLSRADELFENPARVQADFDGVIAPLIAGRCLDCHAGLDPKGALDLSRRASTFQGGETGAAVEAGKPDESLLWQYIESDAMPPEHPLSDKEKQLFRRWIAAGAPWGTDPIDAFSKTTEKRAGYDWWSLQPLKKPHVPEVQDPKGVWGKNPIDAFVLQRLKEHGLQPRAPADRRTLIRRLYYSVIGLPPEPEEVEAFVKDTSPDAYERLVDRLLASPHYGEHWARHWLDVVRFGESNGFERDQPRENAWHYRNWVIRALNQDLPYDQFVRQQLAGDLLEPDDPGAVKATGFLVAGPHDVVIPQSKLMRATMKQDELEDIVGVTAQTFLGLTVNCARCHDHKFDPISQQEYYQFAAALSGVAHGERNLPDPAYEKAQRDLVQREKTLRDVQGQLFQLEAMARQRVLASRKQQGNTDEALLISSPIAAWDFRKGTDDLVGGLRGTLHGSAKQTPQGLVLDGNRSFLKTEPLSADLGPKTLEAWVKLSDLQQRGGGVLSVQTTDGNIFDAIVFGEQQPGHWLAGSDHFNRTKSFQGPPEKTATNKEVQIALVYATDGTITAYRNGTAYGSSYRSRGLQSFPAGKTQVLFGLRHGSPGGNRLLKGVISQARLYDRALTPEEIQASAQWGGVFFSEAELQAAMTEGQQKEWQTLRSQRAELQAAIKQLQAVQPTKVYAALSRDPGVSHLLRRGSVAAPAGVVQPGGLQAIRGLEGDLQLAADSSDRDRRLRFARWVTDAQNPLFARVIVNRIWHYHFGQGLVNTPNDFGFNGGRCSHPELLDWLAIQLKENNWSLKALQREILLSATFRQSSEVDPEAMKVDADNRWLWRKSPLRIEAESIRDSILKVAGKLNSEVGGRGYQDVKSYFFKGTQFYEPLDPVGDEFNRRSIYRFSARGGRHPLLETFDCPDPSTTTPDRASTTTPLQALSLMNDSFVLRMSDRLAERVKERSGTDPEQQVAELFLLVYQRPPRPEEAAVSREFVSQHGLSALCRVLLNSNEFLYVN